MTKSELDAITDSIRRVYDMPGADRLTLKALVAELGRELECMNPKFNEEAFRFDSFGMIVLRSYGQPTAAEKLAERADND